MSQNLLPVWKEIQTYFDAEISVIPVRDKDDEHGLAKSPIGKEWTTYQQRRMTPEELFDKMDRYNSGKGTEAVGIIGGAVSGNLEIIDIDVKYNVDIATQFFNDLKTLYPDLFAVLRIHKTPSEGFHILYRTTTPVQGNQKLAGRYATEAELLQKPKTKQYNFIETRGEGGYVCAPPSLNYTVVKADPIPTITPEQRIAILSLCRSYSSILPPTAEPYKPTREENSIYSVNPFQDFNERCDAVHEVEALGWKVTRTSPRFIWFTRPDKAKGISMSFNLHSRFFFCFTSSTELEADKGYTPSNFIALLRFNGDKKQLHAYLLQSGYGKYTKQYERAVVRRAVTGTGKPNENLTPQLKEEIRFQTAAAQELHPYGIFWKTNKEGEYIIDGENFIKVADGLGFKNWKKEIVRVQGQRIIKVEERILLDVMRSYISIPDTYEQHEVLNAYETFIERHAKFRQSRLPLLPQDNILQDDKHNCYKCFTNCVVHITEEEILLLTYDQITKLIWSHNIQPREFQPVSNPANTNGLYPQFLTLAIGPITPYLLNVIGYLSHEYKDETMGYIVVCSEQCEHPEDGGGSGKNIFTNLFKQTTTCLSRPGPQTKFDERFLNSWKGERLLCISDVPEDFDFGFLKDQSTNDGVLKKLFIDEESVNMKDMPKFIITTNYSYRVTDGGIKRRVMPVEFTNFFTLSGGVDVHFNSIHFPDGWLPAEWNIFDSLIIKAVQNWLKSGCKLKPPVLSEGGWVKQFQQTFGQVITGFISEHFEGWCKAGSITNEAFKGQFTAFCVENNYQRLPTLRRVNEGLKEYCKKHDIELEIDITSRTENGYTRIKRFTRKN